MNMVGFFGDVSRILNERGFRAFSDDNAKSPAFNLHQAIRFALVGYDDPSNPGDVAYWEWREMRPFLQRVWSILHEGLRQLSPEDRSVVAWCYSKERSLAEVDELLRIVSSAPLPPRPNVNRRPKPKDMVQSGKLVGSIVEAFAVLHEHEQATYGDLLDSTLNLLGEGASDVDLLTVVDDRCLAVHADLSLTDNATRIPRSLVRAYQRESKRAEEDGSNLSFIGFLRLESGINNLAGLSDVALLKRLLAIEPEIHGTAAAIAAEKIISGG